MSKQGYGTLYGYHDVAIGESNIELAQQNVCILAILTFIFLCK